MRLEPGTKIGPYEIAERIGEGGMGVVYRAHDARLARDVAIKLMNAEVSGDTPRARQMQQEARAASQLSHANILAVFDTGTHEGVPYVVTELLEGESLHEVVARGPTPWRTAMGYATQIAEGLSVAHEHGIVHRDIKPDNVFVTKDGRVKILDFGIATLRKAAEDDATRGDAPTVSQAGVLIGTVGYMSPEQARGQKVDARTDIFAFGCVLYEVLTGKKAFPGDSPVEVLASIQRDTPPPVDDVVQAVRPEVARVVERCLEKDPAKRFQSSRDLLFAMSLVETGRRASADDGALRGAPSGNVSPESPSAPLPPSPALSRRAALYVGVALVADAAVTAIVTRSLAPAPPAPAPPPSASTPPSQPPFFRQITFQRGTVYTARFHPDGTSVVYSAEWEGRRRDLFVTTPGSHDARSLGQADTDAAFFLSTGELNVIRRSAGGFSTGVLARMSLAGGPAKELVDGVRWADGSGDGLDQLVIRRKDGTSVLELPVGKVIASGKPMSYPRLSPDKKHVAFLEYPTPPDDSGRLVVVDREGHRVLETEVYQSIEGLAWRNDDEVWFTAAKQGRALWMLAVDLSGKTRLLTRAPGRLVLHDLYSDGRVIAERNSYRSTLRVGGGQNTSEQDLSWQDFSQLGQLSRDGKQLLFSEEGGADKGVVTYLRPTTGGAPLRLGEGLALALSADASQALVRVGDAEVHLEILPVGPGHAVPLARGSIAAVTWGALVPGEARVVMLANEAGKGSRLFVQDVGGEPRAITGEGFSVAGDALSPDGKSVLATANGKCVVVSLADGATRELAGLGAEHQPLAWTSDARALFVRTAASLPASIVRYDLTTQKLTAWRTLEPSDLAGVLEIGRVSIARNGEVYAYESLQLLSDLFVIENLK